MHEAVGGETTGAPESVAFVQFRVGGFPLAVEAGHVARMAPVPERTRLSGSPPPVVGLGAVGGRPTALVSLAGRLDVEPADEDRVVVVRTGSEPVGLLADETGGLRTAPMGALTPPADAGDPSLDAGPSDPLFRAVVTFGDARAYALDPGAVTALVGPEPSPEGAAGGGGVEP